MMMKSLSQTLWSKVVGMCQMILERLVQAVVSCFERSASWIYSKLKLVYWTANIVKNSVDDSVDRIVSTVKAVAALISTVLDCVKFLSTVILHPRHHIALIWTKVREWLSSTAILAMYAVYALWHTDLQAMVQSSPLMSTEEDWTMPGGLFKVYSVRIYCFHFHLLTYRNPSG